MLSVNLIAQDGNYYSQQPDSKGALIGGTGTAGSRELSTVYYNPGIIALFSESNIGISGNLYSYEYININKGTGRNHNLVGNNFQVIPSLFAGTFKWKKNKKFTSSYAYVNMAYYQNRLSSEYTDQVNLNGKALSVINRYDIRTKYSEDWFGAGVSYKINEHLGIGVIPYLHFYTQNYMQRGYLDASVVENSSELIFGVGDFRESRLFSPGFLVNIGLVFNKNNHEVGLTIISPRVNVQALAFSSVERTNYVYAKGTDVERSVLLDNNFKALMKRPLEINIGYAYFLKQGAFKFRMTYYNKIDSYTMGTTSDELFSNNLFSDSTNGYTLPVASNKSVINIGLGLELKLSDDINFISGFRTDFSFIEKGNYNYYDFTTTLVHWNIYHLSFGLDWTYKWLKLNTGVDYGFSYQKNLSQYIDLEQLYKPINEIPLADNASVNFQQIKLFLGVVLSFQ